MMAWRRPGDNDGNNDGNNDGKFTDAYIFH